MVVAKSRILDLLKVQCRIFSMNYNPERLRTGNKILRQRLRGPAMAAYYPERAPQMRHFKRLYPDLETWDDDDEERTDKIKLLKQRGKAPPKKKNKEQSKASMKKKKLPPKETV